MVSLIIDGILIGVCILIVFSSVRRGFVKTILSLAASIASILFSVVLAPTIGGFISEKFMLGVVKDGISGTISSLCGSGDTQGIVSMLEDMPEALSNILNRYNVNEATINQMISDAKNGSETVDSICETIASPIATTISNVIAFVLCFVVVLIVLKIVIALIDNFFKLPILRSANKAAGLALGIVLAVVALFVYSEVAAGLFGALGSLSPDMFGSNAIEGTIIVKFFSERNISDFIGDVISQASV